MSAPIVNPALVFAAQLRREAEEIAREHPFKPEADWHSAAEIMPSVMRDIAANIERNTNEIEG